MMRTLLVTALFRILGVRNSSIHAVWRQILTEQTVGVHPCKHVLFYSFILVDDSSESSLVAFRGNSELTSFLYSLSLVLLIRFSVCFFEMFLGLNCQTKQRPTGLRSTPPLG